MQDQIQELHAYVDAVNAKNRKSTEIVILECEQELAQEDKAAQGDFAEALKEKLRKAEEDFRAHYLSEHGPRAWNPEPRTAALKDFAERLTE